MATDKQWLGHPRGLSTLFFTEMWERFSYYGMRALLILYMTAPATANGLGFSTERGTSIYGWYTFGVYAASIPGGWLADKLFGLYRAVFIGGVIIAAGHFCMAFPSVQMFFLGLILIVIGTGLLKPNVSSLVGTLYSKDDNRRDAGFSLFYMGINLGAFIAPLICGYLGQKINWHWGFAAAGVGMTLGLVQYSFGRKYLVGSEAPQTDTRTVREEGQPVVKQKLTTEEWKRLSVIGILFIFATLFWAAFEQAGSSLNLFADRFTRLSLFGWEFPSSWFQSEQPLFVIIFAPVFAWLWLRLGRREPSSPSKFVFGLVFVGLGFLLLVPAARIAQSYHIRVSPLWLTIVYLLHTFGELCLSPVALSMVTKLSPPRMVGLMMGVWFWTLAL
ncbi:MAG: Di-/tripeptide transporter, partial [Acidobacteria bacterium]|nr:Di-/tripeptide transporter [Acidobacteriota bacterium]